MDGVTAGWESFFAAEVGAAAALTGLLFVAVSINLSRILELSLPGRAAETLIVLFAVLAVASFGLVPHTTARTFGLELCAVWALGCMSVARIQRADARRQAGLGYWRMRLTVSHLPLAVFLIAGLALLTGRSGGLLWIVGGTLGCFAAGALNAWVLLVEIHR
jgi:modulator of FtsH protease